MNKMETKKRIECIKNHKWCCGFLKTATILKELRISREKENELIFIQEAKSGISFPFNFCPWCGAVLIESKRTDKKIPITFKFAKKPNPPKGE